MVAMVEGVRGGMIFSFDCYPTLRFDKSPKNKSCMYMQTLLFIKSGRLRPVMLTDAKELSWRAIEVSFL